MPSLEAILRANPEFVDQLYRRWRENPDSVDPTWALFFAGFEMGGDGRFERNGGAQRARVADAGDAAPVVLTASGALPEGIDETAVEPALRIYDVVHTYRAHGHLIAQIDPLGRNPDRHPFLELSEFGFTEADLDQEVICTVYQGMQRGTVGEFLEHLRATYCGTIGVEYMDIPDKAEREWLQERMEPVRNHPRFEPGQQREILRLLVAADTFEETLHKRYPGAKRFSLEGGTTLVPLLMTVVGRAAEHSAEELVMGMAHRGRLNVLAHVLGKPYAQILAEFEGRPQAAEVQGYGDVKYHLGYSRDHETADGSTIHLTLAFNPSHLEAVDPIVEGSVRARQNFLHDTERVKAVPLLMHGDAAFAAQGVVAETLMLSGVDAYTTGGTIHVIINNQIGFTTDPDDARSTRYASDIAKIILPPIFHVNGDDPEAVVHVAALALDYRQTFHRDVVIDLVCYRRYGHNELDDPTFTQPEMYKLVAEHPSNSETYARRLIERGTVTREDLEAMRRGVVDAIDAAREEAQEMSEQPTPPTLGRAWKGLQRAGEDWRADTAVPRETLERVAHALVTVPDGFHWHKRLKRLMEERAAMVLEDRDIDWGCGEALAIGSLLLDGVKVRLSGQDTVRGTFSHRHAVYFDAETGEPYVPLNHLSEDQNVFHIVNSPLSENAALGFEYGYSTADPWTLVAWEAQFGDFVNASQVVIDQFLASAEVKWGRMSGLVLLLPHGYEGQGPEHSSARLERFLELCAERSMQVCNPTTPAQLFHALRRQMKRNFRKPLVIMSPKSLLRHKLAVSHLAEFTEGGFKPVLDEGDPIDRGKVRTLLVGSGKVYFTLLDARRERGIETHAIARLEEMYPFPDPEFAALVGGYPHLERLVWVQEEPMNMGAWRQIRHRLERHVPQSAELCYVGRSPAASPATGSFGVHQEEESTLLDTAFAAG
jgi:2-oxoglutarate dehydrogenase E1 component